MVASCVTVKASTPFLVVCLLIAVWWWSSSLSVVLLSPEEFASEEEERKTVSKLWVVRGLDYKGGSEKRRASFYYKFYSRGLVFTLNLRGPPLYGPACSG